MANSPRLPKFCFAGIYQVQNLVNGKRYVGQSKNISARVRTHYFIGTGNGKRQGISLHADIRKYGWKKFEVSILEKINDFSILRAREHFWIMSLKSYDPKLGYNKRKEFLKKVPEHKEDPK